jgi:hypothetical protein
VVRHLGRIAQVPERGLVQFTHIDNRAEKLVRPSPETPWREFNVIGAEFGPTVHDRGSQWAYG